jgi:glucosyltransferase
VNVKQNALVSIIVPCYNEQENIELFFEKISQQAKILADNHSKELELIFIDDGSNDDTLPLIQNLAQEDKRVSYVAFSRNFGKEAAIYAGLEHATGAYLAIMDADLQDPPELLGEMCDLLFAPDTSYHCIAARRSNRAGEPILRSFFARQFYKIINYLTGLDIVDGARDFRLMKREMADAILMLSERNRFSKGIFP